MLQRSEIVAMINTLHRFSESLHATEEFRGMWTEREAMKARAQDSLKVGTLLIAMFVCIILIEVAIIECTIVDG